jgi:hypothetical protein
VAGVYIHQAWIALTLPHAGDTRRILWRHAEIFDCRLPDCISDGTRGSASLRDEMVAFPLAATISTRVRRPHRNAARHWWPYQFWGRYASILQQGSLLNLPSLPDSTRLTTSRNLHQPRAATADLPNRAAKCIQRPPLSRNRSRTPTTLRRWMLPIVERGPPDHSVMISVA